MEVDTSAVFCFEQQANVHMPDVVAVDEDPVTSVGQDLAAEFCTLESSTGGSGDEAGAGRSSADRDRGARVNAKDQKRVKFHEDESVEVFGVR
ncbi:MAG TPA: hypothetical protein VFS35_05850 [Terrimicrobiaceae bacterium]|nr:hypothetical protein [Terrimicrobiaceae bacterium]